MTTKTLRRAALVVIVFILMILAVGYTYRMPLLIAYHRSAMIHGWQPDKGLISSVRRFFGLPPREPPRGGADTRSVWWHRDALVKLGYLTTRNYPIPAVAVDTEECAALCMRVATQAKQQPTAMFGFDAPGSNVVSLTIWATAEEFPGWEKFVAELASARTRGKQSRQFLADALERLLAMPLKTEGDLAAWHAASKELRQTIRLRHPDLEYEGQTYRFLTWVDAQSRRLDPAYRRLQEDVVRTYIAKVRAEK